MKKYIVTINCTAFQEIEVEAKDKKDAVKKALDKFQCEGQDGQFDGEIKEV